MARGGEVLRAKEAQRTTQQSQPNERISNQCTTFVPNTGKSKRIPARVYLSAAKHAEQQ